MQSQSLLKRKPKSDLAAKFVGPLSIAQNKLHTAIVPGSNAKQYHVIIRRNEGTISAECRLQTSYNNHWNCQGNGPRQKQISETICYHSRAAIDYACEHTFVKIDNQIITKKSGYKLSWCTSHDDAKRLNKIYNGRILKIKSHQNRGGIAYVIYHKK